VVAIFAQTLWDNWLARSDRAFLANWLALFPSKVIRGHVWQLLTYPLIEGAGSAIDLPGLGMGALSLYFFGGPLESLFGRRGFIVFLLLSVVLGGVVGVIAGLFGSFFTQPTYGLTPLGLALTAAWGARFPDVRLVFPPVSGKVLVYILIGVQVLELLARSQSHAPAVALADIAIGWALARNWSRIDDFLSRFDKTERQLRRNPGHLRAIPGGLDPRAGKKPIDKKWLN
jgi:membrane associated rhomboid family serine protease